MTTEPKQNEMTTDHTPTEPLTPREHLDWIRSKLANAKELFAKCLTHLEECCECPDDLAGEVEDYLDAESATADMSPASVYCTCNYEVNPNLGVCSKCYLPKPPIPPIDLDASPAAETTKDNDDEESYDQRTSATNQRRSEASVETSQGNRGIFEEPSQVRGSVSEGGDNLQVSAGPESRAALPPPKEIWRLLENGKDTICIADQCRRDGDIWRPSPCANEPIDGAHYIHRRRERVYLAADVAELVRELQFELKEAKDNYGNACQTIASMHAAAVGEITGPKRGVVEDVIDVRKRAEKAESRNRELSIEIDERLKDHAREMETARGMLSDVTDIHKAELAAAKAQLDEIGGLFDAERWEGMDTIDCIRHLKIVSNIPKNHLAACNCPRDLEVGSPGCVCAILPKAFPDRDDIAIELAAAKAKVAELEQALRPFAELTTEKISDESLSTRFDIKHCLILYARHCLRLTVEQAKHPMARNAIDWEAECTEQAGAGCRELVAPAASETIPAPATPICPSCDEHHPPECVCPPHEVRSSKGHKNCQICHPKAPAAPKFALELADQWKEIIEGLCRQVPANNRWRNLALSQLHELAAVVAKNERAK